MFRLQSEYQLKGDQPEAVDGLTKSIREGNEHTVLLGVTGSGKTFTMANVIDRLNRPALVISHNKTLAAQLYQEFKTLFPDNRVEYFVSYYDYYQPEAYIASSDIYIEKDSAINADIERLRHNATHSVLTRPDTIVVASVSCIYSLGSPDFYRNMHLLLTRGDKITRKSILSKLVLIKYERSDFYISWGQFRVRGDRIDIFAPGYDNPVRIILNDDEVERLSLVDALSGRTLRELEYISIAPNNHYIAPKPVIDKAVGRIKDDLQERVGLFEGSKRFIEAQRIYERTMADLEAIKEIGFCKGIENYSIYLSDRERNSRPYCFLDYLPGNTVVFIDESHVTLPQFRGMYHGDLSRKKSLIEYGFRLPSALDNRPLNFEEFMSYRFSKIYVSATPAEFEKSLAEDRIVEQIVRPTGLIDPPIEIRDSRYQVDNVLSEIALAVERKERVLITTLTKRMSEDLAKYLQENRIKAFYLHSEIDTLDRYKIITKLRRGEYDCIVGVNLLREGLDIPEVSVVAVFDADKTGFLRSESSLIQTIGRCARNINGKAIFYAETITPAMESAIRQTDRKRQYQLEYNRKNNITPESITKNISELLESVYEADYLKIPAQEERMDADSLEKTLSRLTKIMQQKAKALQFEEAAKIRDEIKKIKEAFMF